MSIKRYHQHQGTLGYPCLPFGTRSESDMQIYKQSPISIAELLALLLISWEPKHYYQKDQLASRLIGGEEQSDQEVAGFCLEGGGSADGGDDTAWQRVLLDRGLRHRCHVIQLRFVSMICLCSSWKYATARWNTFF
jgi:hypothetical protein